MEYTFEMGSFFSNMMYYATLMFGILIPIGAISVGLSFGVGVLFLIIKVVRQAIGGAA